jgi:hypothetical protein
MTDFLTAEIRDEAHPTGLLPRGRMLADLGNRYVKLATDLKGSW